MGEMNGETQIRNEMLQVHNSETYELISCKISSLGWQPYENVWENKNNGKWSTVFGRKINKPK